MFFWAEAQPKVTELWTGLVAIVPGGVLVLVAIKMFQGEKDQMRKAFLQSLKDQEERSNKYTEEQRKEYLEAIRQHQERSERAFDRMEKVLDRLISAVERCPTNAAVAR